MSVVVVQIARARSGRVEELVAGRVVNRIQVDAGVAHDARVALDRMLALRP